MNLRARCAFAKPSSLRGAPEPRLGGETCPPMPTAHLEFAPELRRNTLRFSVSIGVRRRQLHLCLPPRSSDGRSALGKEKER